MTWGNGLFVPSRCIVSSDGAGEPVRPLSVLSFSLILGLGCVGGTGPGDRLRTTLAYDIVAAGAAPPVTAEGRPDTIVITGGPHLTCGAEEASGDAARTGKDIEVELRFSPPGSCPFAAVDVAYTAIVSGVPSGRYRLSITQRYWMDQPPAPVYDDSIAVP